LPVKWPAATDAPHQTTSLFDHRVGNGEHPWQDLDAERSRCLKIDDQLEFDCPLERNPGSPLDRHLLNGVPLPFQARQFSNPVLPQNV